MSSPKRITLWMQYRIQEQCEALIADGQSKQEMIQTMADQTELSPSYIERIYYEKSITLKFDPDSFILK